MDKNIVVVHVCSRCIHRCFYCCAQFLHKVEPNIMSVDKFNQIMDIAKNEGYTMVIPYHIGEPLLHPDYDKILLSVAQHGFHANIHSRFGIPINFDKYLEAFKAFGKFNRRLVIELTIDGLPGDTKIDAINMDYKLVWDNVKLFTEFKKMHNLNKIILKIATIVTSYNENRLDQIEALARHHCVGWYAKPFGYINGYELPEHIEMINELAPCDKKWRGYLRLDEHGNVRNKIKNNCTEGGKLPVINLEGGISICCLDSLHETSVGNVFIEKSINKILDSEEYKQALARGRKKQYTICKWKC